MKPLTCRVLQLLSTQRPDLFSDAASPGNFHRPKSSIFAILNLQDLIAALTHQIPSSANLIDKYFFAGSLDGEDDTDAQSREKKLDPCHENHVRPSGMVTLFSDRCAKDRHREKALVLAARPVAPARRIALTSSGASFAHYSS
jgi:hypothetical protein